MNLKKHEGAWVPDYSSDTLEIIMQPGSDQIKDFYLKNYKSLFPEYTPECKVLLECNEVYSALLLRRDKNNGECTLPSGMYKTANDFEIRLIELPTNVDDYIDLHTDSHMDLSTDVQDFFDNREMYFKLGISHRRGALLYGPPGNGKTRLAVEVSKRIIKNRGGVAVLHAADQSSSELLSLGKALRGKPCILIIEELCAQKDVSVLLSVLDGEESWDNVYTVATTNYPERLERNIVNRPGRFDLIMEFESPDREQRRKYLENFIDVTEIILDNTKDLSVAYLRYIVSEHLINDRNIGDILEEVNNRREVVEKRFKKTGNLGF